jgi:hypothetical protein
MIKTAYILSAGRSGSTLLSLMLGAHPDAFAVGEVTHLPKNLALNTLCMCGSPVRECAVWKPVVERMGEILGADLIRDPYAMNLGFIQATSVIDHEKMTMGYKLAGQARHASIYLARRLGINTDFIPKFKEGVTRTQQLFDVIRETHGVRMIVDESKVYVPGIALYRRAPAETRLILLSRDGRGVINSLLRSGMPLRTAVKRWKNYYTRTLQLLEKVPPEHIVRITYEDLATNTEQELRRISDQLGLDYHAGMKSPDVVQHIANGNDTRFRNMRVQLDTRWHDELPDEALDYFDSVAGSLNRQLNPSTASINPRRVTATGT